MVRRAHCGAMYKRPFRHQVGLYIALFKKLLIIRSLLFARITNSKLPKTKRGLP